MSIFLPKMRVNISAIAMFNKNKFGAVLIYEFVKMIQQVMRLPGIPKHNRKKKYIVSPIEVPSPCRRDDP